MNVLQELQAKLRYFYSRIDEINEEINIINKISSKQTNKQTGSSVINKIDGFNGDITIRYG